MFEMTKQQKTFLAKMVAGHRLIDPNQEQTTELVGFNQDGDAIIGRTFASNPNRQYRYLVSPSGKVSNPI